MPARFEWTPLYFKEVKLIGSNAFGVEEYDGVLVKIRWLIRIRVFLEGGESVLGEKEFRLGDVPSAAPTGRATGRSR